MLDILLYRLRSVCLELSMAFRDGHLAGLIHLESPIHMVWLAQLGSAKSLSSLCCYLPITTRKACAKSTSKHNSHCIGSGHSPVRPVA